MRHITMNGVNLIKRFEGFSAKTYICPAGYPTIGYGHLVLKGEEFNQINEVEAVKLLRHDAQIAERAVLRLITTPLNDSQFDALVSFTYNLGGGALQSSTLRRKILRREYDAAANEFRRWVFAGGRKLSGLVRRRNAERDLFMMR